MRKKNIRFLALAGVLSASVLLGGCSKNVAETSEAQTEKETVQETTAEVKETEAETESMPEETEEEKEKVALSPAFLPVWIYTSEWGEFPVDWGVITGNFISTKIPQIYLLDNFDTEHEGLKKVFDSYTQEMQSNEKQFRDDYYEIAAEDYQGSGSMGSLSYEARLELGRTDEKVFSFLTTEATDLGGHTEYSHFGSNYVVSSGKKLSLKEVTADFDGLCSYVGDILDQDEEDKEYYSENYRDLLKDILNGEDDEYPCFAWYFTNQGIHILFEQYALSDYAFVYSEADVPYSTGLIRPEYEKSGSSWAQQVKEVEDVYADLNGDGKNEHFMYNGERGQSLTEGFLTITCDDHSFSTESLNSEAGAGMRTTGYLLHTETGKTFLYVLSEYEYDDYTNVSVYDLSNGDPKYVDVLPGAYLYVITTPDTFLMSNTMDLLGTYPVYRLYRVGENGLPESLDDEYVVEDGLQLTSVRELEATMLDENGKPGEKEKLPSGTVFTITGTDGETYVRMKLDDGRQCRLYVEPKAEGWGSTLDGVDESECFEFVPYAG